MSDIGAKKEGIGKVPSIGSTSTVIDLQRMESTHVVSGTSPGDSQKHLHTGRFLPDRRRETAVEQGSISPTTKSNEILDNRDIMVFKTQIEVKRQERAELERLHESRSQKILEYNGQESSYLCITVLNDAIQKAKDMRIVASSLDTSERVLASMQAEKAIREQLQNELQGSSRDEAEIYQSLQKEIFAKQQSIHETREKYATLIDDFNLYIALTKETMDENIETWKNVRNMLGDILHRDIRTECIQVIKDNPALKKDIMMAKAFIEYKRYESHFFIKDASFALSRLDSFPLSFRGEGLFTTRDIPVSQA